MSYSGGWSISEKLVNVATRQVVASDSLRGQAPSTAPTTLSQGVDSGKVLEDMSKDLVNQVVASVPRRTFPVTVVALDGANVVLSQGGQALKEGARYAMVTMGNEMKDPQTGQSLGRVESPCCELVVERVTPNLSYGRLENVRSNLAQLPVGGLQLREQLSGAGAVAKAAAVAAPVEGQATSAAPVEPVAVAPASVPSASAVKAAVQRKPSAPQQQPSAASKDDDKW